MCGVGGTKARLKRKEKVVGVKMRGQLEMDKFFHNFARDRKNGWAEVGWICTVTTFVEWPDGGTFPLYGKL